MKKETSWMTLFYYAIASVLFGFLFSLGAIAAYGYYFGLWMPFISSIFGK